MEKLLVQGHTDSSLVFISGGPSASDDGFGETCKAPSIARATNNLIRMNYGINPWKTNDRMGIHDKNMTPNIKRPAAKYRWGSSITRREGSQPLCEESAQYAKAIQTSDIPDDFLAVKTS